MMSRTQIAFNPELQRRARERAAELGISLAEYIRRLVDNDLKAPEKAVTASAVFDLGSSSGSDIAHHKDVLVGEAVDREYE